MQVEVNTDNNIEGSEELTAHVKGAVEKVLEQFIDRVTRVEVHLSDVNSDKSGEDDKRCMMEVRLEGRQPTAVTHEATTLEQAVAGAAGKLKRSVEHTLDRESTLRGLRDHR